MPSVLEKRAPVITQPAVDSGQYYTADEGVIGIVWEIQGEEIDLDELSPERQPLFELQQALTPDFEEPLTIYRGIDPGSTVSGLSEADYYFRVRAVTPDGGVTSAWSEPLPAQVKFKAHSEFLGIQMLWWMMGMGGVVFVATVGFLIVRTIDQDVDDLPDNTETENAA